MAPGRRRGKRGRAGRARAARLGKVAERRCGRGAGWRSPRRAPRVRRGSPLSGGGRSWQRSGGGRYSRPARSFVRAMWSSAPASSHGQVWAAREERMRRGARPDRRPAALRACRGGGVARAEVRPPWRTRSVGAAASGSTNPRAASATWNRTPRRAVARGRNHAERAKPPARRERAARPRSAQDGQRERLRVG